MQLLTCRLKRQNNWLALAIVVLYMIAGLSESFYPAAAVNPSLFFLILLFDGYKQVGLPLCGEGGN